MSSQLDRLDAIALRAAKGDFSGVGVLSTGEKVYVAMASNNMELLDQINYTIAEGIARLGDDWTKELVTRWQYRGNPKNFAEGEGHD